MHIHVLYNTTLYVVIVVDANQKVCEELAKLKAELENLKTWNQDSWGDSLKEKRDEEISRLRNQVLEYEGQFYMICYS